MTAAVSLDDNAIFQTLTCILDALSRRQIFWRLEGSANLRVQGMKVPVRDIDVTTYREHLPIFREALSKFVVKEYEHAENKARVVVCNLGGVEVEVICRERDDVLCMRDEVKNLRWHNLSLPVLPLAYAEQFYGLIGRTQKAQLIRGFLQEAEK